MLVLSTVRSDEKAVQRTARLPISAAGLVRVDLGDYQYNVFLPDTEWFWQEEGTIYWLNISAIVTGGMWGWKSSYVHFTDDACWAMWGDLRWHDIWEPPNLTESLDLAFVITGGVDSLDFGDAPDPTYPTLLASNGARHIIVPGVFLGATIDPEADGQPAVDALGDDNLDGIDDEDGVVFTSLVNPGNPVNVKVTASVGGFLDAWVDFNDDGDWTDPGEQIFMSTPVVAGANFLNFAVPGGAQICTTYSRFRFSTAGALADTGFAVDGEVEDYRVFIQDPIQDSKMHWEQWPDLDSTGMDVDMHVGPLADDWMCTETGWVKDMHFWGSFADDILPAGGPGSLVFQLTICNDIPTPPSHPGDTLWTAVFGPGDYDVHLKADNNPEDWYDPWTGVWLDDNHLQAYQYDFILQETDWFAQELDVVYWLEIRDVTPPTDYTFGWKTTTYDLRHRDDAVFWLPPWTPMVYPPGHEYDSETLDLAFVITGEEDCPCGDCNGDGRITIADATYIVGYI